MGNCRGLCPKFSSRSWIERREMRPSEVTAARPISIKESFTLLHERRGNEQPPVQEFVEGGAHSLVDFGCILLWGYFIRLVSFGRQGSQAPGGGHSLKQFLGDVKGSIELLKDVKLAFIHTRRTSNFCFNLSSRSGDRRYLLDQLVNVLVGCEIFAFLLEVRAEIGSHCCCGCCDEQSEELRIRRKALLWSFPKALGYHQGPVKGSALHVEKRGHALPALSFVDQLPGVGYLLR